MIFADAARFNQKTEAPVGNDLSAHLLSSNTGGHLGPGAYYTAQNEALRSGWIKRSFSKRQPMSPGSRVVDRHHHYTAGVLLSTGFAVPGSSKSRPTPGPGHYLGHTDFTSSQSSLGHKQSNRSLNSSRPQSAGSVSGTSKRGSLFSPGSPRLLRPNCLVRDDIIFHSKHSADDGIGPGYYAPVSSSFVTKSFNSRVKSQLKSPSGSASPKKSPSSRPPTSPSSRANLSSFMSPSSAADTSFPFQNE